MTLFRYFLNLVPLWFVLPFAMLIAGCSAVQKMSDPDSIEGTLIAALTIRGVVAIIGSDADRAQAVKDTVFRIRPAVEQGQLITVALLEERINESINWSKLNPGDAYVLNRLLANIKARANQRVGVDGVLSEDDAVAFGSLLDLVDMIATNELVAAQKVEG